MKKPPSTLVDRPAYRDWTIWVASVFVSVAHLWDVVDIYVLDRRIYRVLGPQGSLMTLLAELLLAAMTATFVVVVLTTSRRTARNWRYQRYLTQNVTILTSASDRRGPAPHAPIEAPVPPSALPSPRPRPVLVRLRFHGGQRGASSGREGSLHSRG
ncbi:MAG: hypothetical protein M3133_01360 [Actinomycetota bacterium]|nr:hypothetical protein [Actinomycetota bacterium]